VGADSERDLCMAASSRQAAIAIHDNFTLRDTQPLKIAGFTGFPLGMKDAIQSDQWKTGRFLMTIIPGVMLYAQV